MALRAEPSASDGSTISAGGGLREIRSSAASTLEIDASAPSSRPRVSSSSTIRSPIFSSTAATSASASFTRSPAAIRAAFCLSRSPFIASISALSAALRSVLSDSEASSSASCVCAVDRRLADPVGRAADRSRCDGSDWASSAIGAATAAATTPTATQRVSRLIEPHDKSESAGKSLAGRALTAPSLWFFDDPRRGLFAMIGMPAQESSLHDRAVRPA